MAADPAGGGDAVDRSAAAGPDEDGPPVRILLVGGGEATRRRLDVMDGVALHEEGADPDADDVDVVLVSTRLPRTEALSAVQAQLPRGPVVALVHTGGEALAADLVRTGARGLVAEGNELAVRALLTGRGHDTGLLEVYDRQVGRAQVGTGTQRSVDPITRLPNAGAFDARIGEAKVAGEVPRIGFVRVLFLLPAEGRTGHGAVDLVRRRLALQFAPIAASFEAELHSIGPADFAVIADALSANRAELLGRALSRVAVAFAPWGVPLQVAVGHAGPEVSQDPTTVRRLAERAVEVAALEQRSTVVGAETLALGASSTTELEAALRLVEVVERQDPLGPGHGADVAELAAEIAWELGYEGRTGAAIRLAAHLHGIGRIGMPPEAMVDHPDLSDDLARLHRSHVERADDLLRPLAGPEIAAAVRGHRERWDGTGYPDGLRGDEIPVGARIVAIAADLLRCAAATGAGDALARVIDGAGAAYDPAIVEAVTPLLAGRLAGTAPGVTA
jgi:HD-GYP domain-containing protein (c-di-GMP phosphodiesterase class II)